MALSQENLRAGRSAGYNSGLSTPREDVKHPQQ